MAGALLIVLALCSCFVSCESSGPGPGEGSDAGAATAPLPERSSRTLPIPGAAPATERAGLGARELSWDVPAGWIVEQPSSSMRRSQYRVQGPGGDGECVVFYFGTGQGGDPLSNADRWAKQFTQPDGGSSLEVMQTSLLSQTQLPVHLVEVTGTYNGGMMASDQPAEEKPNFMLLGAIVEGPDAPWFFKFTGPEQTVRAQREAFIRMLQSVRVGR